MSLEERTLFHQAELGLAAGRLADQIPEIVDAIGAAADCCCCCVGPRGGCVELSGAAHLARSHVELIVLVVDVVLEERLDDVVKGEYAHALLVRILAHVVLHHVQNEGDMRRAVAELEQHVEQAVGGVAVGHVVFVQVEQPNDAHLVVRVDQRQVFDVEPADDVYSQQQQKTFSFLFIYWVYKYVMQLVKIILLVLCLIHYFPFAFKWSVVVAHILCYAVDIRLFFVLN